MRILALLAALLLAAPAEAQFNHRSNPGTPGATASTITTVGTVLCPGTGCVTVKAEGADTVYVSITGTWNQTLGFFCTNTAWATKIAVQLFPYSPTTAVMTAGVLTTTANGDFQGSVAGWRECGVVSTVFTSGAAVVNLDASPNSSFEIVQGIPGGIPVGTTAAPTSTVGTQIACNSGASPCTVTNAALTILNANTSRKSCFLQAVDVVDLYCKRATSGASAASATNFDFILNAGSATKKGGGTYTCDSSGGTWQGAMNCIASAASAVVDLAVTETQ